VIVFRSTREGMPHSYTAAGAAGLLDRQFRRDNEEAGRVVRFYDGEVWMRVDASGSLVECPSPGAEHVSVCLGHRIVKSRAPAKMAAKASPGDVIETDAGVIACIAPPAGVDGERELNTTAIIGACIAAVRTCGLRMLFRDLPLLRRRVDDPIDLRAPGAFLAWRWVAALLRRSPTPAEVIAVATLQECDRQHAIAMRLGTARGTSTTIAKAIAATPRASSSYTGDLPAFARAQAIELLGEFPPPATVQWPEPWSINAAMMKRAGG
jgi:hypothetical protein